MTGTLLLLVMLGSLEDRILECAAVEADAPRLECFDAIGRSLSHGAPSHVTAPVDETAQAAPKPVAAAVAPHPAAATEGPSPERDFGLTAAQMESRDGGGEDELEQIESAVMEVLSSRSGKHAYRLENGQVWRQIEATTLPQIRAGEAMIIRRASLGSFLASGRESGRPPVRVRRQQ